MSARSSTALCAMLALCASLLPGCGSDGGDAVIDAPVATVSPAESLLGADLLPPDGVVAAASVLGAGDLPPDATTLGADDLPPAS